MLDQPLPALGIVYYAGRGECLLEVLDDEVVQDVQWRWLRAWQLLDAPHAEHEGLLALHLHQELLGGDRSVDCGKVHVVAHQSVIEHDLLGRRHLVLVIFGAKREFAEGAIDLEGPDGVRGAAGAVWTRHRTVLLVLEGVGGL